MRIPSSLTEETLYSEARRRQQGSAQGRRRTGGGVAQRGRSSAASGRRVLRLAVLLGLVLLLMNQAADPQVYRNFFAALGAPLEPPPEVRPTAVANSADRALEAGGNAQQTVTPLTETVATLDEDELEKLAAWLSQWRRTGALADSPASDASLGLEEPQEPIALAAIAPRLSSAAAENGEIDPQQLDEALAVPAAHPATVARLTAAVDARLLAPVSDATIWQSADRLAFYRCLEAGALQDFSTFGGGATRVGFVSLFDQPAVYRGRPVWLEGNVARVERHEAAENPFGVAGYWLVWLRPDDGSDRPVMVYATRLPPSLQAYQGEDYVPAGPVVRGVGVFLRRHLYRSVKGSELAPVVVGQVMALEAADVVARGDAESTANGESSFLFGWMLAAAGLFAVLFTLWVAWRTRQASRWQREMRHRGLPTQLETTD